MTRRLPPERVVPRATYRIQLSPEQSFDDAAALVPYLAELGISHLYLSPCLEAVKGSMHGYDVTDPTRIRDELGGAEGLERLSIAARDAGLGLVLDIVSNHVGLASPGNPWWWDVLAHGPESRYARHFDLFWRAGAQGQPSLLLPVLGAELEDELKGDALQLVHETAEDERYSGWRIAYHEHAWPVRPGSLERVGLDPHDTRNADRSLLGKLLEHQHYRLAFWRLGNEELDHRRFFDEWTLGAISVEIPEVFDDAHCAILPLVQSGVIDGLRIDHIDGLRDPRAYLERLRKCCGPRTWILVEKILEGNERLPHDWPIDGTVGYRFADFALGVHIDSAAGPILDELQATLTGEPIDREGLIDDAKRMVLATLFGAEMRRLTAALMEALPGVDAADARAVVLELVVAFPVYRTYVQPARGVVDVQDAEMIDRAVARVRARDTIAREFLDGVRGILMLELRSPACDAFVAAFQQLTGPAIAKGLEDTLSYRDLRFVGTNEVGSDPRTLGHSVGEMHVANVSTLLHRSGAMSASSTHDTKRSEDVRARLAVLTQDPDAWVRTVFELRELAAPHRGTRGPTPAHEHLVFQTLVGAWPIDAERLTAYLRKAAREGKEATDWLDPDKRYEREMEAYARGLLGDERFVAALERVVETVREPGWLTSLSMTLLKLTSPGVPDTYQGCELWDLSLVDPDNRRPVDFELRRQLLDELATEDVSPEKLLERLDEGLPKLALLRHALALRAELPEAFGPHGGYRPLWPSGPRADLVMAFLREDAAISVLPLQVRRLGARFAEWSFGDTRLELPPGVWRDRVTGDSHSGEVSLAKLLGRFPVALLARVASA